MVAFDFLDGVRGARLADATTDADGAYSMDVGVISGAILLEVDESGAQPVVSAVADMIRLGEAKGSVQLSPITHLTAVYAQHLGERLGPAEAIVEARRAVEGLFGGVAHHAVPAVDVLTVGAPSSSAGLVAGVLSVAFSAQAEALRTMPGSELGGDVSASELVRLYADDLRDGFIDGLSDGRSLRFAGHRLDAETFRAGYGEAVLRFLAGPRNATTVGPADFQSLVDSIRRNSGPLFPPDQPPRLDTEAPTFSMVSLERGEGERLPINPSISGRFVIEVRAQDNVGVAKISLAGNSTAAAGPDRVPAADHALYVVSPEGLEEGTQEWTIEAVDASGNAARSALLFRVDRTPPRILLSVPSVVVTSTVEISGEWIDASPGVMVLRSGRNEVARVDVAPGPFARTVPIPCGAAVEITALGVDAAGNPSATARTVTRCNAVGPQLGLFGTEVVDEGTLEITRDVTTGALAFLEGQGTQRTRISERASSPMRFRKLFSRLEAAGPNLPTFSVLTSGASSLVYRWRVDGEERRGSTPLPLDASGRAELALSFLTLGPELADVSPDQRQTLEFEARAPNGTTQVRAFDFRMTVISPPVWLSGCRALSGNLPWASLGSLYTANGEPEAFEARVDYVLDRSGPALGPAEGVDLVFGGTVARTQVLELSAQKWFGAWTPEATIATFSAPCGLGSLTPAGYEVTAGWTGITRCVMGANGLAMPDDAVFWDARRHGAISDLSVTPTRTTLMSLVGAAYPVTSGRTRLPGDAGGRAVVRMVMPSLQIGGGRYLFPTTFDPVPQGHQTTAQVFGRYRLPGSLFVYDGRDLVFWGLQPDGFSIRYRTRPFTTRASLHRISIELEPLSVTAAHPRLPWAPVEVRRDASCLGPVVQEVVE